MRLSIEMTDELANIDDVWCRIWNGHTDDGIPVRVYVHRVAVPVGQSLTEFKKLLECDQPDFELTRRVKPM